MEVVEGVVWFGISIPLDDFAGLATEHLRLNPATPQIEASGQALAMADFPEDATQKFVREVCGWGGYSGVGGRVLKLNAPGVVSDALREATGLLNAAAPDVERALRQKLDR